MTEDEARDLDHAWRYFSLHAEQRMTVFNFYVASAGLALTGLAWTLADGSGRWPLGAAAGIGAAALSFVFWRLDQRGSQLVKAAEDAMVAIELGLSSSAAVTTAERRLTTNGAWYSRDVSWTFGRSFRLLFGTVALLGMLGAALTASIGISASWRSSSAATHPRVDDGRAIARSCASDPRGGGRPDVRKPEVGRQTHGNAIEPTASMPKTSDVTSAGQRPS